MADLSELERGKTADSHVCIKKSRAVRCFERILVKDYGSPYHTWATKSNNGLMCKLTRRSLTLKKDRCKKKKKCMGAYSEEKRKDKVVYTYIPAKRR